MLQFNNLQELLTNLDEKTAREFVEEMRWGGNPVCPFCNASKPYRMSGGKFYRCRERTCKKDFSVTVGTIFENTKIKLSTWIAAIYLLTAHKKGISSHQLARDLGVTQKTAWFMLCRIRLIMKLPQEKKLQNIVEIDETYVGGKMGNMHTKRRKKYQEQGESNKTPVMGLVERGGNAHLTVIGERNFKEIIYEKVNQTAEIHTDEHASYIGLVADFRDHVTVNHTEGIYGNEIACTNTVEGLFSLFKRMVVGIYHQVSPKHLHRYCEEMAYRYNTRKIKDKERFIITLQNTKGRLTYQNLTKKK